MNEHEAIVCKIGPGPVRDEGMEVREHLAAKKKAIVEVMPDVAVVWKVPPGDEVVQTAGEDVQKEQRQQDGRSYPTAPDERQFYYSIAAY